MTSSAAETVDQASAAEEAKDRPAARPSDRLSVLMVRYQAGEAAAFSEIFEALRRPLRLYLASLVRDSSRTDDLMQETLLQLHRSRRTYRPPRPVKPWAFGIARHVYLMDQRARGRWQRLFDQPTDSFEDFPVHAGSFGVEDRDVLVRALAKLAPAQREVLLLHHLWGFSFAEIAQTLGIRVGAAKVRSHRAMARLRQFLEDA